MSGEVFDRLVVDRNRVAEYGGADKQFFEARQSLQEDPAILGISAFPLLVQLGLRDLQRERPPYSAETYNSFIQ